MLEIKTKNNGLIVIVLNTFNIFQTRLNSFHEKILFVMMRRNLSFI